MDTYKRFLNIRYEGERFRGGRLPLDVLADLQALEDILTTFAREIFLETNDRERMPSGYAGWFDIALTGVEDGSALPKLELSVLEPDQLDLIGMGSRYDLMQKAEARFAAILKKASEQDDVVLSQQQIRNFNRFLTNLKPGESFQYSPDPQPITATTSNVIALDAARRKRMLTSVKTTYEQRIQGKARLKNVDETGLLKFVDLGLREFPVSDETGKPADYGKMIGSYYEYDLTVVRRHDDTVQSVITIHDLSPLEHPSINAIDEMAALEDGWLDGHGQAIIESVREQAKLFVQTTVPLPELYATAPTEKGNILLEFKSGDWDYGVEFLPDGSFEFFGVAINGPEEMDATFGKHEFKQLQEAVIETLKS